MVCQSTESIEYCSSVLFGNARPGIADFENHLAPFLAQADLNTAIGVVITHSVIDQVSQHNLKHAEISRSAGFGIPQKCEFNIA